VPPKQSTAGQQKSTAGLPADQQALGMCTRPAEQQVALNAVCSGVHELVCICQVVKDYKSLGPGARGYRLSSCYVPLQPHEAVQHVVPARCLIINFRALTPCVAVCPESPVPWLP